MPHCRKTYLFFSLFLLVGSACESAPSGSSDESTARGNDSQPRDEQRAATSGAAGAGESKASNDPAAARSAQEEPAAGADEATSTPARRARPVDAERYPWLDETGEVVPLSTQFGTPDGYERIDVEQGSFAAFLRGLPVRTDRFQVLSYAGEPISAPAASVIRLDVGDENLQQCADSLIRLHAEWLWSRGRSEEIGYHFTSGDLSTWSDWKDGERFVVRGASVERRKGPARDDTHETFRAYLSHLFTYAGTRSLRRDANPVDEIQPGDFFVAPGSPGHAVMVLDVAVNDEGERIALLGQGFMPAQEFHVIEGHKEAVLDEVWWPLPSEGETLDTPSWEPFPRSSVLRFED